MTAPFNVEDQCEMINFIDDMYGLQEEMKQLILRAEELLHVVEEKIKNVR